VDGIRPLIIQDIKQALELSSVEGWNQTEKDWELLIRNPGNICLAAEEEGKVIATAVAMNYENTIAWIGMVLVHREHRGQGLSKILLNVLLEKLESCKSVKLDATPAGQPVYQKFGFKHEYLIHRMVAKEFSFGQFHLEENFTTKNIDTADIPQIIELDKTCFGASRKNLIEYLISEYPEDAFVLKERGRISGFSLGRTGCRFHQIGPLVAETTANVRELLLKALSKNKNQPVVLDIPAGKTELADWLITIGFTEQRPFVRMYLHENPFPGIPEKQFLICGPEFG
jgi:GNAT superfamily N-acetyltransferase